MKLFFFKSDLLKTIPVFGGAGIKFIWTFLPEWSPMPLNSILFFGLIGTLFVIMGFAVIQYRLYKKKNLHLLYMNIFIFINLLKSDSILYVGSLVFYLSIFYIGYEVTKNEKINSK